MNIQENISLQAFNTFGINKNARFFTVCKSIDDLKDSLSFAAKKNLPVLILGGGSNILLTKDLEALVMKNELKGIHKIKEDKEYVWVEVGAGEIWHDWVMTAIENNWAGIENLSLIPGTVGASPMQNIGAYGVEIKEVFEELKALNRKTLEIEKFDAEACQFGYRESVFKNELKDQYIICSVTFRLRKNPIFKTEYGAIQEILEKNKSQKISIKSISDAVIAIRKSKLPNPKEIGNAGSFFKNPTISNKQYERIRSEYPQIPGYPTEEGIKIPAAWLIEQAGWKGKRFGEIGVHEKQPLVLVNYGKGEGKEVKSLSEKIQKSVLEKFGIQLTPEVNFL
ncbi:UDP-N-acetylmuramate dehydrogenase [Algoriphagus sp. CAU 1675]|uniref:UDP-N-acetylmuramate dehydrogenase n=1 Tax=Algoriphagus sp. CAU 1675 TaxID=3032597 RepID=UPI0023DC0EFE|nr:UDP-N-acetylmuramate dehydrogenase [Algoriphagus sp. CAU 1675]MDF2157769.1 UDP-N-acetylmuramate dehydrogenase [Algoriphagus sp. CAU 1675]